MLVTVAHSPDSDDAFMFYALAKGLIDTGPYEFRHVLEDIETLNRRAVDGTYEVTAISIHAFAHLSDRYALLNHGASMGDGSLHAVEEPSVRERIGGRVQDPHHQRTSEVPSSPTDLPGADRVGTSELSKRPTKPVADVVLDAQLVAAPETHPR